MPSKITKLGKVIDQMVACGSGTRASGLNIGEDAKLSFSWLLNNQKRLLISRGKDVATIRFTKQNLSTS